MNATHVEIRHIRGQHEFGRAIMYGQLYRPLDDKLILQGSLAQILQYVKTNKLEITNAQAVLTMVVLDSGFAS
jgi:hypothetical protein